MKVKMESHNKVKVFIIEGSSTFRFQVEFSLTVIFKPILRYNQR